jgi:ribose transport system substrate-binding protein
LIYRLINAEEQRSREAESKSRMEERKESRSALSALSALSVLSVLSLLCVALPTLYNAPEERNQMNWKRIAVIAGLAFAIAGCGEKKSEDVAEGGKPKTFKITLIAKSSTNPVFLAAKSGAEAAAKELSAEKGMEITIDWQTPPQEDGQVQAQNIANAVAGGTDAILISCSDAAKVTGAINDAVDKGVPVMTFDSDAPDSKRFAFYGADDIEVGRQVADELAKITGEKSNVAILAGNQNAPNLQKRVQGVKDELAKHPNMKFLDVYYHPETPQDAAKEVNRAMQARPEIDGWAMVGGWPLFTQTLLTDLDPTKVKVVAVDALPAQLAYVEKGIAPVLLAQPIFEWGNTSVRLIVKKLIDKEDVPEINKMELVRVTKESLGEWAKKLQDWGMEVDPKYLQ